MPFSPIRRNRTTEEHSLEEWLVSEDPAKQELAAETFFEMGSEQSLTYLLSLAKREQKATNKRIAIVLSVSVPLTAGLMIFQVSHHTHTAPVPLYLFISPTINLLMRQTKLQKKIYELLAEQRNVRALPAILDCLRTCPSADRNALAKGVTRLLPSITSDNVDVLSEVQWKFVVQILSPRFAKGLKSDVYGPLVRSILLTCGNLGMTSALPRVKTLAEAKTKDPAIQELQQTARNYVTLLEHATNVPQMVVRR